jgi:photosystem II stability/assembly factor-like uncharacterized protein
MRKYFFTIAAPLFFIVPMAQIFPTFGCAPTRDGGIFRSLDRGETFEQKVTVSKNQTIAGADILSIKIDPQDSKIIYLGTVSEGIFKSMDGGDTWYRLNETNQVFSKRANVYDIAIDPNNSAYLYVGTYQDRLGRLFRSPDGGKNWEEVYRVSRERYAIFAVEIDSFDPSVVYIGTAEGGLLKSSDFGKSWRIINWFDDVISDIKVDPHDTRIVYVSTLNKGLYKTTDKGSTWQHLDGVSSFFESRQIETLVMDNRNPNVLYTGSQTGLLKSVDGGTSWQRVNIVIPPNSIPVKAVALDPVDASALYYAAGNVLYRSSDNGQTWVVHPIATSKTIQVITIDPKDSNVIYLGLHQ